MIQLIQRRNNVFNARRLPSSQVLSTNLHNMSRSTWGKACQQGLMQDQRHGSKIYKVPYLQISAPPPVHISMFCPWRASRWNTRRFRRSRDQETNCLWALTHLALCPSCIEPESRTLSSSEQIVPKPDMSHLTAKGLWISLSSCTLVPHVPLSKNGMWFMVIPSSWMRFLRYINPDENRCAYHPPIGASIVNIKFGKHANQQKLIITIHPIKRINWAN